MPRRTTRLHPTTQPQADELLQGIDEQQDHDLAAHDNDKGSQESVEQGESESGGGGGGPGGGGMSRELRHEISTLEETVTALQQLCDVAVNCARKFAVRDAQVASLAAGKAYGELGEEQRTAALQQKNQLMSAASKAQAMSTHYPLLAAHNPPPTTH